MKICFFADGESIHTIRWCKHFQLLGHQVHLITFKDVTIENISIHYVSTDKISVKGGNWKVLLKFLKVKQIVQKINPDIFHAHYATSYGITGALAGFHPYIITALGTDVLISPKQSYLYKTLLKYAFSKADWITAMADHMKIAIQELGVDSSKISTIPFGIDPLVFNSKSRKLNNEKFVITSTRNFENVYNIPHFLKAVAKVKNTIPNLQINLIGDGSQRSMIRDLIRDLNIEDITILFGKISQTRIAEILNQSHLFVSVSLSDGNNISLNEAMACGALPIVTNIPANTQWINDNENGFLVEINDVEILAEKLVYAFQNYGIIHEKMLNINQEIIKEKALWSQNMEKVQIKYNELINHK